MKTTFSSKFQVERIYANISEGKIRKYWSKIIIKKLGDDKIANNIDDDVDDDDDVIDGDNGAPRAALGRSPIAKETW